MKSLGRPFGSLRRFVDPSLVTKVAVVGSMTIGVKAVAFLKEVLVAHRFGTSDEIDCFLVAFLVPTLIAFIAGDAFRDAVIPVYSERRLSHRREANRLVSNSLWLCGGLMLVLSLAGATFASPVIDLMTGNFSPEKVRRGAELLPLILPYGIAFGLGRILQAYLQANDRFAASSLAPAIIPAVTILFLVLLPEVESATLLAVAVSLGGMLLCGLLLWEIRRSQPDRFLQRPGWDEPTRSVARLAIPLLAVAIVFEGCFFIDTVMASWLSPGSVAVLNYGARICNLILSVGGTAVGFVLFPHVSDLVAKKAWKEFGRVIIRFSVLTLLASLPLIAALWIFSEPIVRLLLERGEFTAKDTSQVAEVLRFAAFQIPGQILAVLGTRAVMALRGNRFLLVSTILALGINVGLNLLFIEWFGLKGIALSTAVVNLFTAGVIFGYLAIRIRGLKGRV